MAKEAQIESVEFEDDELYSDDLLPSEGGSGIFQPEIATEYQAEEAAEKSMVQSAGPLFNEILDWFAQEIAWSKSVEDIDLESKIPADSQILAKQRLHDHLMECNARLIALRDAHLKK